MPNFFIFHCMLIFAHFYKTIKHCYCKAEFTRADFVAQVLISHRVNLTKILPARYCSNFLLFLLLSCKPC